MKRVLSVLTALAVLLSCAACVSLTGCGDEKKSDEYPVTFGDVTITEEPQAIVILNDSIADIVACIGYDYKMVGRSSRCDQDFLSDVEAVGTPDSPDTTAIVKSGADLVIADSTLSNSSREKLNATGITVIQADRAVNEDELIQLYTSLGAVLGGSSTGRAKGEKAYNDLFDRLDRVNSSGSDDIIKTAVYLYIEENGQLCTFTKGSLEQRIFGYCGAVNILSNQENPAIDSSELRMGAPSCIFYDDESVLDYLRNDEKLSQLAALKASRTCLIPLRKFYRQGLTYKEIVNEMAKFIKDLDKLTDEATPDEATPDEPTSPPETEAPATEAADDAYYEEENYEW